ncbi:COMM domain-containing protein 7-like [Coregonus clupeaformis]|uniref:COMM domain-containing protein 7-like n=1 Tax=Coregonus clupeaformis TaxID=59861 RepID=UPI001BE0168C|nr:COMM domain-containing protein 7-like [Coregonus clupeaformis]
MMPRQPIFHNSWKFQYPVLSRLAVRQTLMVNQLVDMEWKFGVYVSSSLNWSSERGTTENVYMGESLTLAVPFSSQHVIGSLCLLFLVSLTDLVSFFVLSSELTLPQFYNFLHEMERAKASMDCFS